MVCPRAILGERWLDGDLSEEHWKRIRADLKHARHVHLQGWGEPLLHPRIESMARDAHAAGCRVGLTTNGDLLVDARDWIVDVPVDVVAVSLAGCDSWNRRLRDESRTEAIFAAVEAVARARGTSRRPRLHVAFLLVRGNAGDLPEVVRRAAASGADEVLVNHVDFVHAEEILEIAAYADRVVPESDRQAIAEAEQLARNFKIGFRPPALDPQEMLTCDLDPRRMASVRWDGVVAPCVHLNLPITGAIPRATVEGPIEIQPPVLGHLDHGSIGEILDGEARREFTAPLHARCAADQHYREWGLVASGWGVVGIADLDRAYGKLEDSLAQNPFPAACRGCPKTSGW